MYDYHKKGLNDALIDEAILVSITRELNTDILNNEFDDYGNIIRNHKSELQLYVKDETFNLLPKVDSRYFDAFRECNKMMIKRNNNFVPVITKVRLARLKYKKEKNDFSIFILNCNIFKRKLKRNLSHKIESVKFHSHFSKFVNSLNSILP